MLLKLLATVIHRRLIHKKKRRTPGKQLSAKTETLSARVVRKEIRRANQHGSDWGTKPQKEKSVTEGVSLLVFVV